MKGKMDSELEESMKKVFMGLHKLSREQEEKQNKKIWSEVKVPFSLQEGLSKYTKYDLDEIRKTIQIQKASNLKKAELLALLNIKILESFEDIIHLLENERFRLITNIANHGGQMTAPYLEIGQIRYFHSTGLIYTGTFEGKKILALPDELIEPIKALKNNVNVRVIIKRNTEWIQLTNGLLYYYGTLPGMKLVTLLEKHTNEKINFMEYMAVIENAISYRKEIYLNEDGFSNSRVFDSKKVLKEHQMRNSVPYFPFTKQQLILAGELGFIDKNISYVQFVNFLSQNFELNMKEADSIVEECVYATRIDDNPNDVMQYLASRFEFDNLETVQAVMDHVVVLMNNTRKWVLKGHTSIELRPQGKVQLQPLPTTSNSQSNSGKVVKIGRNEPCSCGSGKKHKKCCGVEK